MPPTLRSAQSSPTGKNTHFEVSPGTPGRKAPKCTKCGQPRLGHPRSSCPPDTFHKDIDASPTSIKPKTLQENLSQAFGSMYLETSTTPLKQPEVKGRHSRYSIGTQLQTSETLVSISTSAEDMLQDLTKPGFFSQETAADEDFKGSKEQDGVAYTPTPSKLRIKSGPQILMPGTLMAPSWESSIGRLPDDVSTSDPPKTKPLPRSSLGVQTSLKGWESDIIPSSPSSNSQSLPSSQTSIPRQHLQESQTQEQREQFLSSLSQTSPASVYIHKKESLDAVLSSAQAVKLHVRTIESNDKDEEDILLVIGTEFRAVEKLATELAKSIKDAAQGTTTNNYYITQASDGKPSSSNFRALASGALAGVVGTWAGLAFS